MRPLRIQLWCWNYEPEPTAMGPIAALWAKEMQRRGHDVSVVTAHPHYPPIWGSRLRPYREVHAGVPVLRLPIWAGHRTALDRVREEVTYAAASGAALAVLPSPDVYVAVSPAFLALGPMIAATRVRRRPWLLWLQDILPDAAVTTGLLRNRLAVAPARALERAAYASAARIVVISESFRANLTAKGVDEQRLTTIYNPASRGFAETADLSRPDTRRILHIGNIGFSQGLERVVRTIERSSLDARLIVAGAGERSDAVTKEIQTDRVQMLGLVDEETLDAELSRATVGLVTQRPDVSEFNLPSRVMTLMARGVPIVAVARADSELAHIIRKSQGGWIADCNDPEAVVSTLHAATEDTEERSRRAEAALEFARNTFAPSRFGDAFEAALDRTVGE